MPQSNRPRRPEDRIPTPDTKGANMPSPLDVKLPGGGVLTLLAADEVVMWNETQKRYIADYRLSRTNDLVLLGAVLAQVLILYRAQKDLVNPEPKKQTVAQAAIAKAADEIRKGEKALGIDKATRERGGAQTVADYVTRLKRAAYEKGVHISERLKAYEAFAMEERWKLRILRNGDTEDKSYHAISEKAICEWAEKELARLEELDKTWNKEKASIWVGKL